MEEVWAKAAKIIIINSQELFMHEQVKQSLTIIIKEGKAKPELYDEYKRKLSKSELICSGNELVKFIAQQETLINCDAYLLWDAVAHFNSDMSLERKNIDENTAKQFAELIYKESTVGNLAASIAYLLLIIYGYAEPANEIIGNILQQCSEGPLAHLALGLIDSYGLKGGNFDIENGQQHLENAAKAGNKLAAIFYYKQLAVAAKFGNAQPKETARLIDQLNALASQHILQACHELTAILSLQADQIHCSRVIIESYLHSANLGDERALQKLYFIYVMGYADSNNLRIIYKNFERLSAKDDWDNAALFFAHMPSTFIITRQETILEKSTMFIKYSRHVEKNSPAIYIHQDSSGFNAKAVNNNEHLTMAAIVYTVKKHSNIKTIEIEGGAMSTG